jgi:hypothetical protein
VATQAHRRGGSAVVRGARNFGINGYIGLTLTLTNLELLYPRLGFSAV